MVVMMGDEMEVDDEVAKSGSEVKSATTTGEEAAAAGSSSEPVGQLEDEARRRKERLKALRQKLVGATDEKAESRKIDAPLPKYVGFVF
jgi:hypothetical protein